MKYAVILEKNKNTWSVSVPDLPGCGSTGHTIAEALGNIREAVALHLAGFAEDGEPIPDPTTVVEYVDVSSPLPYAQTAGIAVLPGHASLKQMRLSARLTQQELAQVSGVRQETISRIESGRKPLTPKMQRKIHDAVSRKMRVGSKAKYS